MMRIGLLAVVLGLSACAVHDGNYPTYRVGEETAYDRYRTAREAALLGQTAAPSVIPVTLPVQAPTAEEIEADSKRRILIGAEPQPGTVRVDTNIAPAEQAVVRGAGYEKPGL